MTHFKYKSSINVPYYWQGFVYFKVRLYSELPQHDRDQIKHLCRVCGKEYSKALFEYVTTDSSPTAVCMKHYMSEPTLYRATASFVEEYYKVLKGEIK